MEKQRVLRVSDAYFLITQRIFIGDLQACFFISLFRLARSDIICLIQRSTQLLKRFAFSLDILLLIRAEVLIHDQLELILDLVQHIGFLLLFSRSCKGDWVVKDNKLTLGILFIVPVALLLVKSSAF